MITNIMNPNNSIALDPQKIVAGVRDKTKESASGLSKFADSVAMVQAGSTLGMLSELNESHEALFENMTTYKKVSAAKALEDGIDEVNKKAEELSKQASENSSLNIKPQKTSSITTENNTVQNKTEVELSQTQMPEVENVQIEAPSNEIEMQELLLIEDVTAQAMEELLDLYV